MAFILLPTLIRKKPTEHELYIQRGQLMEDIENGDSNKYINGGDSYDGMDDMFNDSATGISIKKEMLRSVEMELDILEDPAKIDTIFQRDEMIIDTNLIDKVVPENSVFGTDYSILVESSGERSLIPLNRKQIFAIINEVE